MNLFWTERALIDIAGIDNWLSKHADSQLAVDQLDKVRLRARRLGQFPQLGSQINTQSRSVSVRKTPYVLVYRVRGDQIEILRVRHNRQDWRPSE